MNTNKIKWVSNNGIELEEAAEHAVEVKGNVLVVAGPGAGKTELLAQKANYLFKENLCRSPYKILAISFKKDSAVNLKDRVISRLDSAENSRFKSMTYDAFFKRLVDQFRLSIPERWRPEANYLVEEESILNQVYLDVIQPETPPRRVQNELSRIPFIYGTCNDRQNMLWNSLLKGSEGNSPCLTFDMIGKLALYLVEKNPIIKRMIQTTFPFVFLDEFQDTTNLQYKMVRQCFLNSHSVITAVGDNKQRIMVWAGARKTVFADFRNDFQAKKITLVMNHRSAPRLVSLQEKMYDSLNAEPVTIVPSNKWHKNDGTIKLFKTDNEDKEAQIIGRDIQKRIQSGVAPSEICIIVKQTPSRYVKKIALWLSEHDINSRIESIYQNLIKEPVTRIIVSAINAATGNITAQEWEEYLLLFLRIRSVDSENDYVKSRHLNSELVDFSRLLSESLNKVTGSDDIEGFLKRIVNYFGKDNLRILSPQYSQGNYFEKIIDDLIKYLEISFNRSTSWKETMDDFLGIYSIPIMTIHKSKGLEYQAVYFIGLEDQAFWNFKKQPEEDRSAFFVAISRAKTYLAFSYCGNRFSNSYLRTTHIVINEFYELLQQDGVAEVIIK